ncbi:MAG TPA: sulfatase-like hydrolase/transferase [Opitutaceae bacterium]
MISPRVRLLKTMLPVALGVLALSGSGAGAAPSPAPNIIVVLCDDLGFGDTGFSFQRRRAAEGDRSRPAFATPALDRLAAEGLQLRNHYAAAPVCAPSRASLLRGLHQGHAEVRDNQFDKALADHHTLASVLRQGGYATAAIGKWGLQGRADGQPEAAAGARPTETPGGDPSHWRAYPTKRGFDFFLGYVRHKDGHRHYPHEDGRELWENEREISADLARCYTTDLFTARAKQWIVEHQAASPGRPFFLYLAYDTPHAQLQNPPCPYPAGGGLRGGVQWTGRPGAMLNTATGEVDAWMDPEIASATWDHDRNPATPEIPWPDVQQRHANGVRRIDAAVGDLAQLLKDLAIDDRTLVIFTSDNGPARESYLKDDYDPDFFRGYGPFDGIKRDLWEGGVRVPTFVRWPGHIAAGGESAAPSAQWDWLATFAELAGLPPLAASDGVSLVPTLTGEGRQRPSLLYFEYANAARTPDYADFAPGHRNRQRHQMQAVHVDRYKGVRYDIQSADDDFEIYDLSVDAQEAHNLAGDPRLAPLQAAMKARVLQLRRPDSSAPRPYDAAFVPAVPVTEPGPRGVRYTAYEGAWPWMPEFQALTPVRSGSVERIDLAKRPRDTDFGLMFEAWFHAETDGEYAFTAASDAGVVLFVHEARVIDDDFGRTGAVATGAIRLAAGWHPLRLYYRHGHGDGRLEVSYRLSGGASQPLDAAALAVPARPRDPS